MTPVNDAEVIELGGVSTKSSAASISKVAVPGRLAIAMRLLGVRLL
jgi:hypothetical protein